MTKPLKAYMVTEDSEGHACIVFATNSATARREGGNELGVEWEGVESCKRSPEYDQYAPGPVPNMVLIDHGWWFECSHCGRRVSDDMAQEAEDDGLNPDNFEAVESGDWIFCSHECLATDRLEKVQRKAAEAAMVEYVTTMWPQAIVTHVHVYGPRLEADRSCYAMFSFPGSERDAEWKFPEDTITIMKSDLDAWNAYKAVQHG
jgi:hypothetical protein